MSGWVEVRALLNSAPEDWSLLADAFDRWGCPGSIQEDNPLSISGYFPNVEGVDGQVAGLTAELMALGAREVVRTEVEEQDWSELWKIHFKPRQVGRFLIRPTWEDVAVPTGAVEIVLDPGQAFGTGDHPTTRLCLQLMSNLNLENRSILDLGCGSGILAIAAAKCGAHPILATDIDPLSVQVARENMALNQVEFTCEVADGFPSGEWPIVISNIISATLIRLAPMAAQAVQTGGMWIVSGIIVQNWPDVLAAAEKQGFTLLAHEREDDWIAATFRR